MVFRKRLAALFSLGLCLLWPCTSEAQYLTDQVYAQRLVRTDPFQLGSVIDNPQTLKFKDFPELFRSTAGKVSPQAVLTYSGFEKYWAASSTIRAGKAFEAILASRANWLLAQTGSTHRVLVTAAEGQTQAPADLVKINSKGQVIERYQLKLGRQGTLSALTDRKYRHMKIVTNKDTLKSLEFELKKQKVMAARRGVQLKPQWKALDDAVRDGRITDEIVPGHRPVTRGEVDELAKQWTRKEWMLAAEEASGGAATTRTATRILRLGGKVVLVVTVAYGAYETYRDVGRYRAGEIGGFVLAAKSGLRVGEVGIVLWLGLADPEPITKTILIATGGAIVAANVSLDYYASAKRERTQKLLEKIDYDERFFAVRRQLLLELE